MRTATKILASTAISLFSSLCWGRLSASDIVAKVDSNQISFQRGAQFNQPEAIMSRMIAIQSSKYPNFRPSMFYYHFVEIDGIGYFVSYDWGAKECNFTWIDLKEAAKNKGASQLSGNDANVVDANKSTLPIRVCEKLYNFYQK